MAFKHELPTQGATNDWLTPPHIFKALGFFDLDPCASEDQPWETAYRMISPPENGLTARWKDGERVWLNPPYGKETYQWLNKLSTHAGGGIALTFARTETQGFFESVWGRAHSILFLSKRINFHVPVTGERGKSNAGSPSVLIAYSERDANMLKASNLNGAYVRLVDNLTLIGG